MFTLYDSDAYDFDEVKKDICECNEMDEDELSDDSVWNAIRDYLDSYWSDAKRILDSVNGKWENATWIIAGNVTGWRGTRYGLRITDDICNVIPKLGDTFKITTENGHLNIEARHHDGGCSVEAKIVTNKGKEVYNCWNYGKGNNNKNEAEILEMIFNYNLFSKPPHLEKELM